MAMPLTNGGTHNRQERYAKTIVALMRPQTIIYNLFRKDYVGNPTAGAVQVPVRNGEVLVQNDYNVLTGGTLTQSATTFLTVPLDTDVYINELIDGYEAAAVPDNLIAQRLDSAAYSVSRSFESRAVGALMGGAVDADDTALTNTNAYTSIKDNVINLKKLGININEIKVIVSPDTEALLLEDIRFANTAGALGAELVRDGVIGKIAGAQVYLSSLLGDYAADTPVEYVVFAQPWAQAIDEWKVAPNISPIMNGEHIGASALQGRFINNAVLTNSNAAIIKTVDNS